jgi:hypothetical protein
MRAFWRGLVRTLFWSYERMTWQYDLMVIAIVVFVLLAPRGWFHDQPQSAAPVSGSVEFVSEDVTNHSRTYHLAAASLPPEKRAKKPTPELEKQTHDILSRSVDELRGRTFQVLRIDPVIASDGSVVSYNVTVR